MQVQRIRLPCLWLALFIPPVHSALWGLSIEIKLPRHKFFPLWQSIKFIKKKRTNSTMEHVWPHLHYSLSANWALHSLSQGHTVRGALSWAYTKIFSVSPYRARSVQGIQLFFDLGWPLTSTPARGGSTADWLQAAVRQKNYIGFVCDRHNQTWCDSQSRHPCTGGYRPVLQEPDDYWPL